MGLGVGVWVWCSRHLGGFRVEPSGSRLKGFMFQGVKG